jgi:hypothetical protein
MFLSFLTITGIYTVIFIVVYKVIQRRRVKRVSLIIIIFLWLFTTLSIVTFLNFQPL